MGSPPRLYQNPAVYHWLHWPGTEAEISGLSQLAARFCPGAAHWLEPACGTGRYLKVLAERGVTASGFDVSSSMLAFAAELTGDCQPQPHIFRASLTDFASSVRQPVDVAFSTINTIRHLESDDELQTHLEQIASVLAPSGIYALGLSLSDYEGDEPTEDIWEAPGPNGAIRQVVQYLPPTGAGPRSRREMVISHVVVEGPDGPQHLDDRYELRTYDEDEWTAAVATSPLQRIGLVDERGVDLAGSGLTYGIHVLRLP